MKEGIYKSNSNPNTKFIYLTLFQKKKFIYLTYDTNRKVSNKIQKINLITKWMDWLIRAPDTFQHSRMNFGWS